MANKGDKQASSGWFKSSNSGLDQIKSFWAQIISGLDHSRFRSFLIRVRIHSLLNFAFLVLKLGCYQFWSSNSQVHVILSSSHFGFIFLVQVWIFGFLISSGLDSLDSGFIQVFEFDFILPLLIANHSNQHIWSYI